jgi:hypothetical protein
MAILLVRWMTLASGVAHVQWSRQDWCLAWRMVYVVYGMWLFRRSQRRGLDEHVVLVVLVEWCMWPECAMTCSSARYLGVKYGDPIYLVQIC